MAEGLTGERSPAIPASAAEPFTLCRLLPRGAAEHLLTAILLALVALVGVWPLLRLFAEALGPGQDGRPFGLIHEALASRAVARAFTNTLTASLGSVLISTILGAALALATGLLELRGRVAMTFLILSPLLIPSQITALAWIGLTGPGSPVLAPFGLAPAPGQTNPIYSPGGIMLLMGIEHMPLVFLAVRAALIGLPESLAEAARIAGAGRFLIVRRIVLPLVLPAAGAGAILAFAAAIGNFGVPALLGIPGRFSMLTTLIYQRLNGFGPSVIGQVAVLALLLVAMAGAALALRALLLRAAVPVDRAGPPLRPLAAGRWRPLAEAAIWLLLGILTVLPMAALLATSLIPAVGVRLTPDTLTLGNFSALAQSAAIRRAFVNSTLLSLGAALLAMAMALGLAWLGEIRRQRLVRAMGWAIDMPFVVPGTVLALACILVFLPPLPLLAVSIYATPVILLVAYLARFLPLALRPTAVAMQAMEPGLDEAARILGAGPWRRISRIMAPLAAPSLVAGGVLIFLTAFNELTVSALLWSSGVETVGVTIFSLQYEGNSTQAAAVSAVSVALVLILVMTLDRLARHLPPGTLPWRAG